ncbi:serine protease [Babesia caballi]|uniref:Serine protease n=1 Tax=Babesia caballi TaxID=5871 RepID=A0AAV4M132_BABCB|nr:serine protease [Babesia caballi]
MASAQRRRELMAGSEEDTEAENPAKRRASFQWPGPAESAALAEGSDAGHTTPTHIESPGAQSGRVSPMAMGVMPMPGIQSLMRPMPQNDDDPMRMGAFQGAMGTPILGTPACQSFQVSPSSTKELEEEPGPADDAAAPAQVLGGYPADEAELKARVLLEGELYEELRERVDTRRHLYLTAELIDRYFKCALGASTRPKVARLVQQVIDDRDTSVDESRRLKHLLEWLKNPNAQAHKVTMADSAYLKQLSDAHKTFVAKYSNSRKIE